MTEEDREFITNSPVDRLIGMLMERITAVRELHDSQRVDNREQARAFNEMRISLERLVERMGSHEKADDLAFQLVHATNKNLIAKLDGISAQLQTVVTQNNAVTISWKVLAAIGGCAVAGASFVQIVWSMLHG